MFQKQQDVEIWIPKPRHRTVRNVIPSIFIGLLAVFQMILSLAILGLESASIYYDAGRGTIYAGIWCSIIFFITWISMSCYLCCGNSSGCGIYLILQNIINIIFAIILVIFTSRFIDNPCLCYGILCKIPPWDDILGFYSNPFFETCGYFRTARTIRKLPVLKGLLSCAVLMFVSNIIFIVVYIITYISLRDKSVPTSPSRPTEVSPYQSSPIIDPSQQYQQPYLVESISEPHYYSQTVETTSINEMPSTPVQLRSEKF